MWRLNYAAHQKFLEPVHDRAQLWRTVLGTSIAVFVAVILFPVFMLVASRVLDVRIVSDAGVPFPDSSPQATMVLLGSFGMITLSVTFVLWLLHRRSLWTVLGQLTAVKRHFLLVTLGMAALLLAVLLLPPWGYGDPLVSRTPLGQWLMILPLSLVFVLIQTSAEEIFFRGYLQQQLAARFQSPLVWMILPSVVFALGHWDGQGAGENAWILVLWAGVFGVLMADLTARAGNLGPAMAVHFVNNTSAIVFVSMPGGLDGLALYVLPFGLEDSDLLRAWLPVDFMFICVSWLVARLAIRC